MEFSAGVMWAALGVLLASMLATFLLRRHRWSRRVAVIAMIVFFQATFFLAPPALALFVSTNGIDLGWIIGDILGRVMVSAIAVSGVQGRWIWQPPKTSPSGPSQTAEGQTFYE